MHHRKGQKVAVKTTVPAWKYEALLERLEDMEDRLALVEGAREASSTGGRNLLPDHLVGRLLAGAHPLQVWREHRGLTAGGLAELAGLPASYVSEIASGKKPGSADALHKIALALHVTVDDLLPTLPTTPKFRMALLAQRAEFNPSTQAARLFLVTSMREAEMVVVTRETIEDLLELPDGQVPRKKQVLRKKMAEDAVEASRKRIEKIAIAKWRAGNLSPEGWVKILPGDLD
ncbi:MAG: helix-turn-helix transcriptional regulator [Alphaproteobacteria bacterium]|nr:helix-turn-helix transcriptional regulator [Alphaproteobacteria bacterium]